MDNNNSNFNQQPNYNPAPVPGKSKSIAALVLGIISVVFFWSGYGALITLVLSIVGLILAINAKKEMQASGNFSSKGMATAGLVLCIIGLVLSAIGLISCVLCVSALSSYGWYY